MTTHDDNAVESDDLYESRSTSYFLPPGTSVTVSYNDTADKAQNNQVFGIIICAVGFALGVIGIFFLKQKKPFFGPEIILCASSFILQTGLIKIYNSKILMMLVCFFILLFIRELWGWIINKCSLSWCIAERISLRINNSRTILLWYQLCIIVPLISAVIMFITSGLSVYFLIGTLLFAVSAALDIFCLYRYGDALRHLQIQLESFGKGEEIEVKTGVFAETEKKLCLIREEHKEAIKTAVNSERFKVDLISNVSHDLRTPLTAILGYGELLGKQTLTDEGKEQLSRLNKKAGYMKDLVDELFELTKVSSGIIEPKKEKIDLIRLLEQTLGLLDDQITEANLSVKRKYALDTAPTTTDGTMLHQVFANLIGNAVKYALRGTRIFLELKDGKNEFQVRIVNTANYEMDFSPDEIMQRFVRGDKARSTQGSGLGLAIAQTYTEAVGGSFGITVDGDQFNATVSIPKN
ncbi:MAG: HAMP domain-containing histidine kinase [Clostridia bacterium]|nr:HAMP domain-containing histidine kinase [Clostridia bacterium]